MKTMHVFNDAFAPIVINGVAYYRNFMKSVLSLLAWNQKAKGNNVTIDARCVQFVEVESGLLSAKNFACFAGKIADIKDEAKSLFRNLGE